MAEHVTQLDHDLRRLRLRERPRNFRELQTRRAATIATELLVRVEYDLDQLIGQLGQPLTGQRVLQTSIQQTATYKRLAERLALLLLEDPDESH